MYKTGIMKSFNCQKEVVDYFSFQIYTGKFFSFYFDDFNIYDFVKNYFYHDFMLSDMCDGIEELTYPISKGMINSFMLSYFYPFLISADTFSEFLNNYYLYKIKKSVAN